MESKDFRFDYFKYQNNKVTVERVDKMMDAILDSGSSKLNAIIAACKLIIFAAYIIMRKHLVEERMLVQQQQYEIAQRNLNREDLEGDNLDKSLK